MCGGTEESEAPPSLAVPISLASRLSLLALPSLPCVSPAQNLTHGSSFSVVLDTIPSMMSALRMVWIISRHYNKDERMIPLMERIAWEIAERVCRVVNLRTLFK